MSADANSCGLSFLRRQESKGRQHMDPCVRRGDNALSFPNMYEGGFCADRHPGDERERE